MNRYVRPAARAGATAVAGATGLMVLASPGRTPSGFVPAGLGGPLGLFDSSAATAMNDVVTIGDGPTDAKELAALLETAGPITNSPSAPLQATFAPGALPNTAELSVAPAPGVASATSHDQSLSLKPVLDKQGRVDCSKAVSCKTDPAMAALKDSDKDAYEKTCTTVREDGAYVEGGENDNLLVQKIAQNPKAIGVFGFSFLEENMDKLKGVPMSGVNPTYATISDFSYPGARPLYIYVKKAHLGPIKGLKEFIAQWPNAWGPDGYLKAKGMVISPDDVRAKNAAVVTNLTVMDGADLK